MSVYKATSLNRTLQGLFDTVASEQPQLFWFRVNADGAEKRISDIHCGYLNSGFNAAAPVTDLAQFNIRGRVIVYFDGGDLDGIPVANLWAMFSPFGATPTQQQIAGGTVVYDAPILNTHTASFPKGIKIAPGRVCNVVMTPGYKTTDAGIAAFSQSVGFLTVLGDQAEDAIGPRGSGGPRLKAFGEEQGRSEERRA